MKRWGIMQAQSPHSVDQHGQHQATFTVLWQSFDEFKTQTPSARQSILLL